jgi:hypothetical protein
VVLTRACRTLQALSDSLRPRCVYRDARQPLAECESYQLRALVCYYGSHYASFVRTDEPDPFAASAPETCGAALRARCAVVALTHSLLLARQRGVDAHRRRVRDGGGQLGGAVRGVRARAPAADGALLRALARSAVYATLAVLLVYNAACTRS